MIYETDELYDISEFPAQTPPHTAVSRGFDAISLYILRISQYIARNPRIYQDILGFSARCSSSAPLRVLVRSTQTRAHTGLETSCYQHLCPSGGHYTVSSLHRPAARHRVQPVGVRILKTCLALVHRYTQPLPNLF